MLDLAVLKRSLDFDLSFASSIPFLSSDLSLREAYAFQAKQSLFKKLEPRKPSSVTRQAAINLFLEMEARNSSFILESKSNFTDYVLTEMSDSFYRMFSPLSDFSYSLSTRSILQNAGVGPGACRGAKSYNFYTKLFDSNLSATNGSLHQIYRNYLDGSHRTWYQAEMLRYYRYGDEIGTKSKLSTVAKNKDIDRVICTEPNLNMFFQKGLSEIFEQVLEDRFSIDLSKQPAINQALATRGSIDGSFATIDLKSASDTITLTLLKSILPARLYETLHKYRTPSVDLDGVEHTLKMLSTMGNGFTFSFQTLLFSVLVRSCYKTLGIPCESNRDFAVFGDDIIVRREAYNFVTQTLETCGFIVNTDKSFNTGVFRESCGVDSFKGHDIRGPYIKRIYSQADINATYNRLLLWSHKANIYLGETMRYLNKFKKTSVPFHFDMTSGFYTSNEPSGFRDKKPLALIPRPDRRKLSNLHKEHKVNLDGYMIAFLGGYIRNDRITLKNNVPRYRLKGFSLHGFPWVDLYLVNRIHKTDARSLVSFTYLYEVL